ncbi:HNH endonuclease [Armatimonas rosea]|uniref:HNH nuclease domain-containing protein n=1 Tax=Armatimonas rosea TaxID=685828 RepID=A0A7W9W854_ARMRO|nr:HNH endonuclease signature motif containing protein [Armatimonas rosea]MBB6051272.1 hypothetical protein [Armatimonas rosea]
MNPLHPSVAARALHHCEYCHAPELVSNLEFEIEHIEPVSQGGSDDPENLALACRSCNLHKASRQTCLDPQTQTMVPLFHPRRDRWEEHFHYDEASGELHGLTATGRATVACLQLNRPTQRNARRFWVLLSLFP